MALARTMTAMSLLRLGEGLQLEALGGMTCPPPGFDAVTAFDVADYISAPWYSQMQNPLQIQPASLLYCSRANYTQLTPAQTPWGSQLEIGVDNYARVGSVAGSRAPLPPAMLPGFNGFYLQGSVVNPGQASKILVGPYFVPVFGREPYWIVDISPQPYEWVIVSGGPPTLQGTSGCLHDAKGLWLMTRQAVVPQATIDMLLQKVLDLGMDTSSLLRVQQEGCCGDEYGVPCNAVAKGDPHLRNVLGERFDIQQPGVHALLRIPRKAAPEAVMLKVDARVERLGGACADMYFTDVNVSGSWVDKAHVGRAGRGIRFTADSPTSNEWMRFGTHRGVVQVKVVRGETVGGVHYLNFFTRGLSGVSMRIGGLLGEGDHTWAATPEPSCTKSLSLLQSS